MARPSDEAARRDIEEYRRATELARAGRRSAAKVVGGYIARQVEQLVVEGDVMGGPSMVAMRIRQAVEARRRGDREAERSAAMDVAAAAGAWVAALDMERPASAG